MARPARGSLKELFPEVADQWHPTRNGDLTPADVGVGLHVPPRITRSGEVRRSGVRLGEVPHGEVCPSEVRPRVSKAQAACLSAGIRISISPTVGP